MQEANHDLYVLPDEALPLLSANKIDRRLFDVTELIKYGYDDAQAADLPLIATYGLTRARAASPAPPRGSKISRTLPSINGAALETDKKQARAFWTSVAPSGSTSLQGGIAKL